MTTERGAPTEAPFAFSTMLTRAFWADWLGLDAPPPPAPQPEPAPAATAVQVGRVMIATPCYGGQVTTPYLLSAVRTVELMRREGVPLSWMTTDRESLIQRARNTLTAKFLADPMNSHLVFIDADISWEPTDVLRLIGHNRDVVCGLYPMKKLPIHWAVALEVDEHNQSVADLGRRIVKIKHAATGFLCIKRQVFERINQARPDLSYREVQLPDDENALLHAWFNCEVHEGVLWGEDFGFSRLWRSLGGEIWADPSIQLGHHGIYEYRGDPREMFDFQAPAG